MSETANRVINNTGYLYIKMAVSMFFSLWTTRLILDCLGASDFGIYNIVGGAISMLGFLNAAMAGATQRYMSYAEGKGKTEDLLIIYNVSFILHLIIAIVVGLLLIIAGFFFFNGILSIPSGREYASYIVYGSLIVSTLFTIVNVPNDALLNAHENMKFYAIIGVFESLLRLFIAFACVHSKYDKLVFYGISMSIIPILSFFIMELYCHRHYDECRLSISRYYNKEVMKDISSFAGWRLSTTTSSMITQYGMGIVINHFLGVLLNTAQGIANQLSGMVMTFCNNMLKSLNPVITKKEGEGDRIGMIEISLAGNKFSFFLLACFAIPIMIEMPFVLKLWLKNVPEWAICFAELQLLRSLLEQLTITFDSAISANGDIKSFSIVNSILNIMPLPTTYILFSINFKPYWLYIIWILFGAVLSGITKTIIIHKKCGLNVVSYLNSVILPCILVSLLGIIPSIIEKLIANNCIPPLLSVIISSMMIIIGIWFFGLKKYEKEAIIKYLLTHKSHD